MSDQYITTKIALLQKHKTGIRMMLILALFSHFSVSSANMPAAQTLIQQLGIQQQDIVKLNQGQIVFFNVAESEDIELAAGAAMYLPVAPSQIMSFIKNKTFTDQVGGFGSSFKHSIGEEQERSEMTQLMNSFRNALQ